MTQDFKYPEEVKEQSQCDFYRKRARRLRDQARTLEEIASEIEGACKCNDETEV